MFVVMAAAPAMSISLHIGLIGLIDVLNGLLSAYRMHRQHTNNVCVASFFIHSQQHEKSKLNKIEIRWNLNQIKLNGQLIGSPWSFVYWSLQMCHVNALIHFDIAPKW